MNSARIELAAGAFVLTGLLTLAYFVLKIGGGSLAARDSYVVHARFANTGGLTAGALISIAGVPVGRVDGVALDASFTARVDLRLRRDVRLSTDTTASIRTSGLIGDKFVALSPGTDAETLIAGSLLTETESALDLESLISRFAFGQVDASTASP